MSNTRIRSTAILIALLALSGLGGCGGAEARLASYLERGDQYFSDRNFEKARVEFSNALQIDPKNADARYMAGRVAEKLNNPREAVGQYQAAIDADPGHIESRAALGRLFLFGGLPERAAEIIEPGLVKAPGSASLLTVRGAAKAQQGDTQGAFADAEAALQAGPGDEYAIALLASLYRQSNQNDKAIEVVRTGLAKLPDNVDLRVVLADLELQQNHPELAEEQLRKTVELQPAVVTHWQRLARFYLITRNNAAAEQAMRSGIDALPDSLDAKLALVDFLAAQRGAAEAEKQMQDFIAADKGNDDLKLALGRFLEGRKNNDRAEAAYREVIGHAGDRPQGLVARNRIAALRAQANDVPGAEQLIAEVLKDNPRDNDALILRANLALGRNDAPAAIADLRSVLRDQPNAVPVMRALARAHQMNSESALAEETLRTASEANPRDATTRLDLASLLVQSGRLEQARPLLEKLVTEAPDNLQAIDGLFRVQAGLKDLAAARATAEGLQRVRPDLAIGFYFGGLVAETEQRLDDAVAAYDKALAIQPDGAEPLAAAVRIDLARKQPARAFARLDAVIQQFPGNVVARNLKGELLASQKRFDEAAVAFADAVARSPQWWVPYRGLALSRLGLRDADGAVAALTQGVEKTQGAPALASDLAALYERLGRLDDAIKVYEGVVARNPGSVPASNNLAMLLASYKSDSVSLDRALQLAEKLAGSTEPTFVNTRGWVRYKRGEYQEALPLLQQAVDKVPDSPLMRYHLGMAQLRLGDKDAAKRNLEVAVAAGSPFAGLDEARSALAEAKRTG